MPLTRPSPSSISVPLLVAAGVCVGAAAYVGRVVLKSAVPSIVAGAVFIILVIGMSLWSWLKSRDEFKNMMDMMVERCVCACVCMFRAKAA